MRKGDRCFHKDHGNGEILRVNKQKFARIQFDGEDEHVWIALSDLEEEATEDELLEWNVRKAQRKEAKSGLTDDEMRQKRREDRQTKRGEPFQIRGLNAYMEQKASENLEPKSSALQAERANEFRGPAAEPIAIPKPVPVYPVSLRDMPMPAPDISTFCALYKQCISAEIYELRSRNRIHRMLIHHGERLNENADAVIYALELDSEVFYPEGAEVILWQDRRNPVPLGKGSVASCDGTLMLIEAGENLPDDLSGMYYSVDEAALLESLNERLDELSENTDVSTIVRDLVLHSRDFIEQKALAADHRGQDNAHWHALNAPITFIWGPPGTGKTETLARIVLSHISRGHRVLMLSQCNVSVDAAILRVHQLDKAHVPGRCVRYGYPRAPELAENSELTVSMIALQNNYDRFTKRSELLRELRRTPHTSPRYLEIRKELEKIAESMIQEEKAIVRKAKFVATTVSKAVVDRTLYKETFDVVLFDEASMALVPQIIFSASLCSAHFVCAGDFSQLPPISLANRSALEGDIFLYTGISQSVYSNASHAWLYMLDMQYRMHPDIADFAGRFMYRGLLRNAPETQARSEIARCRPVSGEAIVLLNLNDSRITPVDSSKINLMSALMSFGVALHISSQGQSVGMITPYSPQARLLRCMSRDFQQSEPGAPVLTCSTVHQFQGSEKDIILYDVAETSTAGIMLSRTENNYANRLFNVAMTRARGKFCLVADREFIVRSLPENMMLSGVVRSYYHHYVDLRKQFAPYVCTFPYPLMCAFSNEKLYQEILLDMERATSSIDLISSQALISALKTSGIIAASLKLRDQRHLKGITGVPNPAVFGISSILVREVSSHETVILLDKQTVWYLYIQENGVISGIRFYGKNTGRRIHGIFFNAQSVQR